MKERIELFGTTSQCSVNSDEVFFAFESGRLSYDCVKCGSQCCRGHGYLTRTTDELGDQLQLRPALGFFIEDLSDRSKQTTFVANCKPACFFLDSKNLCGVQVELGYRRKPETCRLFPFNRLALLDNFLLVSPHDGLCPIEVTTDGLSDQSSHDALFDAMRSSGIAAPIPRFSPSDGRSAKAFIELEQDVVKLAQAELNGPFLKYVHEQRLASWMRAGRVGSPPSANADQLTWDVMCQLLSTSAHQRCGNEVTRNVIAFSPAIRLDLLLARGLGKRITVQVDRIPSVMLALFALARLASQAGMVDVNYQTLSHLGQRYSQMLMLLASVDLPAHLRAGVKIDLAIAARPAVRSVFIQVVKALLAERSDTSVTVGHLLHEKLSKDPVERLECLRVIADRLGHLLVDVGGRQGISKSRSARARATVQRWFLKHSSVDSILFAVERRRRHAQAKLFRPSKPR